MKNKGIPLHKKIGKIMAEKGGATHLSEIYKQLAGVPESTIRGRIYDQLGKRFEKLDEGVFCIKGINSVIGLIEGDARNISKYFDKESLDIIIADYPWDDEKAHKGGNRSFADDYETFTYEVNDFQEKHFCLKDNSFLIEFLPEKNASNTGMLDNISRLAKDSVRIPYFYDIINYLEENKVLNKDYKEMLLNDSNYGKFDVLEKIDEIKKIFSGNEIFESKKFKDLEKNCKKTSGFEFYCDIPITGGNNNIGRKASFISIVRIFKKGEPKLRIYDEKLSKDIATSKANIYNEVKSKILSELKTKLSKDDFNNEDYNLEFSSGNIQDLFDYTTALNKKYESLQLNIQFSEKYISETIEKFNKGNDIFKDMLDGFRVDFKKIYTGVLDLNEEKLFEAFQSALNENELSVVKKYNKLKENFIKIGDDGENSNIPVGLTQKMYIDLLEKRMSSIKNAFSEYVEWLKNMDENYKSGSKSLFPEYYQAEKILKEDIIHQSQKPLNVYEQLLLQTTKVGSVGVELFAGSFRAGKTTLELDRKGFGKRIMFGIEKDPEKVKTTKEAFINEYGDIEFFSIEDFYNKGDDIGVVSEVKVLQDAINKNLDGILNVELLFDEDSIIEEYQGVATTFKTGDDIIKIKMLKNNIGNQEFTLRSNGEYFELINSKGEVISKRFPEETLQEVLLSMYNSRFDKKS